jgi:hypothetical protein
MEINITSFVTNEDPFDFSASVAERGNNVGHDTWNKAVSQGKNAPLLTTPEQLDALRNYVKEFGAWDDKEIASWSDAECNALFIQLISHDMREAGMDEVDLDEFNWEEYEHEAGKGTVSSRIYHGDDNQIYYYLGV